MIDPFANNHQSMQIGELVIENQTDKVIIYGDIDLQRNAGGYEQAKQLQTLMNKIVTAFETTASYTNTEAESKPNNDSVDKKISNPFL